MTRFLAALTAALSLTMCALGAMAMAPVDAEPATVVAPRIEALAAATGLAPAEFWCASRRPHAADKMYSENNYWAWINEDAVTARCMAYEGTRPDHVTKLHYYHVTIWDRDHDGVIEQIDWAPLNPITW